MATTIHRNFSLISHKTTSDKAYRVGDKLEFRVHPDNLRLFVEIGPKVVYLSFGCLSGGQQNATKKGLENLQSLLSHIKENME